MKLRWSNNNIRDGVMPKIFSHRVITHFIGRAV